VEYICSFVNIKINSSYLPEKTRKKYK